MCPYQINKNTFFGKNCNNTNRCKSIFFLDQNFFLPTLVQKVFGIQFFLQNINKNLFDLQIFNLGCLTRYLFVDKVYFLCKLFFQFTFFSISIFFTDFFLSNILQVKIKMKVLCYGGGGVSPQKTKLLTMVFFAR